MSEHYSKNTVAAKAWCRKCNAFTMHKVQSGLLGACEKCLMTPETEKPKPPKAVRPTQTDLF